MNMDGGEVTQLTNTFTDILSVAPAPDGSRFYTCLYQHAKESLYAVAPEKLINVETPPLSLGYLSNSFENASKIIPVNPAKDKMQESEAASNFEKIEPETLKEKKAPTQAPVAVNRLDVIEASNIVQLQWPLVDWDSVDNFRVYRSDSAGTSFQLIGSTPNARQSKYVDYDVQIDQSYFYYVTAVNKVGENTPSPVAEAHPVFKITSKEYQLKLSPDILLFYRWL